MNHPILMRTNVSITMNFPRKYHNEIPTGIHKEESKE